MITELEGLTFHSHLSLLVLSLFAGLAAAGCVALIDALLRRNARHDPDTVAPGQYTALPSLERRGGGERRKAPERRWTERRRVIGEKPGTPS
jgi:hypothetical protein